MSSNTMNSGIFDPKLIQPRVLQTLEEGAQLDLSTESARQFLKKSVDKKIDVVILYVDINGSTRMSLTLPAIKFARIIQVFSQEMSIAVINSGGHVFKYVGDAVIAFFPAEHPKQAAANAIECAKAMTEAFTKYINPSFQMYGLPAVTVKVAFEYGNVLVVPYGKRSRTSHVDIVGATISIVAKMLPYAKPTHIITGQAIYNLSSSGAWHKNFLGLNEKTAEWSYVDETSGQPYKLFLVK